MKKAFPIALMILGLVFLGAGIYTVARGFDAKDQVRDELIAQQITTPDDATIPNERVDDAATAKSMAEIIETHAVRGNRRAHLLRDGALPRRRRWRHE